MLIYKSWWFLTSLESVSSKNNFSAVSVIKKFISDDIFPKQPTEQDKQRKKRFCAYRSMVFWLYLELKKGQRRPLPACMYSAIQAMFPPTANEEDFADWRFSEYVN